jgi:transposase-like protein
MGQKFNPKRVYCCKRRASPFLIDETMIQIGSNEAWLWIAVVPTIDESLGFTFQGTEI